MEIDWMADIRKKEYQEEQYLGSAHPDQGRGKDMPGNRRLQVSNIPEISAIYYALLQLRYEYDAIERDKEHVTVIHEFIVPNGCPTFFSNIKQATCDVYPYWPRAFILERATFFLRPDHSKFRDFDTFHKCILSAGNIADNERNQPLWDWIEKFPEALSKVLAMDGFHRYLNWENQWIAQQNMKYAAELQLVDACLEVCVSKYNSPVQDIKIVLNPIKCVYASDYHLNGNCFVFCSGAFRVDSVIHEFLHHVVHPAVLDFRDIIRTNKREYPGIDASYYLSGDNAGWLNAFEEYAVRKLTGHILDREYPNSLTLFLETLI